MSLKKVSHFFSVSKLSVSRKRGDGHICFNTENLGYQMPFFWCLAKQKDMSNCNHRRQSPFTGWLRKQQQQQNEKPFIQSSQADHCPKHFISSHLVLTKPTDTIIPFFFLRQGNWDLKGWHRLLKKLVIWQSWDSGTQVLHPGSSGPTLQPEGLQATALQLSLSNPSHQPAILPSAFVPLHPTLSLLHLPSCIKSGSGRKTETTPNILPEKLWYKEFIGQGTVS